MEYALKLDHVSKTYRDFQLQDISFALPAGYIMGFIGENGAGKSTTIKLILDLIKRDSGQIVLLDQDNRVAGKILRQQVGVVMDECHFPEQFRLQDVEKVLKNIFPNWQSQTFRQLCQRFQLAEKKRVKEYSKGMRMKLSIAAAMSHQAKLLILDECTSGLDPVVRDEILDLFLEFIQQEDHSIFMSSHIVSDLEKVCDYIALLHQGRLLFNRTKEELSECYGLFHGSRQELAAFPPQAVIGSRSNQFGVEALVLRQQTPAQYPLDHANIEDIMLFYAKEKQQ